MVQHLTRKAILAVALCSVLAVAPVAGLGTAGPVDAAIQEDGNETDGNQTAASTEGTITVTATGEAQAQPDAAVLFLAVAATAETPENATRQAAENASRLRTALTEANVSEDAVRTTDYSVYQEGRFDPRNASGDYVAEQGFAVEVDNVSRAGELLDVATSNGASAVRGVQLTLSDETRSELRNEALSNAVDSARSQADAIAASADLQIDGVHSVSTVEPRFGPFEAMTEDAAREGASTQIDPGPLTVSATVEVTYRATNGSAA
ncbi:SIMPL domain-containing protein [Halostella sp. JP-L12]|uniref:SIMPL domain-containing protein n=1 Tax=Halostella TaxID=1843185 RepID=UPI000EF7CBFD|nr:MULTISPECIES: SIMPL domain-containing protein [Halostella]NHN48547.1 SIMPL domain-containing protein [Halostella sp. JP-L12]